MAITVFIPTPLRPYCGNQESLSIDTSGSVSSVFESITNQYPDLKKHLYDDKNELRKFVNIYLNDEDIRYQDGVNSNVNDGDTLSIVPSIAGG